MAVKSWTGAQRNARASKRILHCDNYALHAIIQSYPNDRNHGSAYELQNARPQQSNCYDARASALCCPAAEASDEVLASMEGRNATMRRFVVALSTQGAWPCRNTRPGTGDVTTMTVADTKHCMGASKLFEMFTNVLVAYSYKSYIAHYNMCVDKYVYTPSPKTQASRLFWQMLSGVMHLHGHRVGSPDRQSWQTDAGSIAKE